MRSFICTTPLAEHFGIIQPWQHHRSTWVLYCWQNYCRINLVYCLASTLRLGILGAGTKMYCIFQSIELAFLYRRMIMCTLQAVRFIHYCIAATVYWQLLCRIINNLNSLSSTPLLGNIHYCNAATIAGTFCTVKLIMCTLKAERCYLESWMCTLLLGNNHYCNAATVYWHLL